MDLESKTLFQLPSKTVDLWHCSYDVNQVHLSDYRSLLAKDEVVRVKEFKFKIDQVRYIISRGILRLLLGTYLNANPKEIEFHYTFYGKPMVRNKQSLAFNISHSVNKAVFGFVKDAEIGVDVEAIKTDFNVLDIARNFFSSTEIESLENQHEELLYRAFYRCWTRKEAFIKAEGSGLSFPLDAFAVSLDDDLTAELLETQWDASKKEKWSLFSFVPTVGYIGAIATSKDITTISYNDFDEMFFKSIDY